jgi:HNH endonuclease
MSTSYPDVARRAGHRCEYCHAPEVIASFPFEVEHIHPASRGGRTIFSNLALACRSCNLFKSNAIVALDSSTDAVVPLFHPRNDSWEEHFAVDATTGMVLGRTPIGRATVAQLQINTVQQQQARLLWIRLGLFP